MSLLSQPFMKMNAFKTLAEARTAFETLELETGDLRLKVATIPALEAKIAENQAFLTEAMTENQNFRDLIVQKDGEIAVLQTKISGLTTEVSDLKKSLETLEKGQKTVKQQARELVAAAGGVPLAVDAGEIKKMQAGSEKEFLATMLAEHNPVRLAELYREYNETFRNKKK